MFYYHPTIHRYVALVTATAVTLQKKIKNWGGEYGVLKTARYWSGVTEKHYPFAVLNAPKRSGFKCPVPA